MSTIIDIREEGKEVILPWLFLSEPEVGRFIDFRAKANIFVVAAYESVSERLKAGEKEGRRRREVGDS
jgi:hypothetical protein